MEDTRSEFEKSLDPNYNPGPSAILEKPEVTTKDMEKDLEIDHHTRTDFVVTFANRYQALECWSAIKTILESFQIDQRTQGVMMETMSCLANHIDIDVKKEAVEKGIIPPEPVHNFEEVPVPQEVLEEALNGSIE